VAAEDDIRAGLLAQADQDCAAAYHDVITLARDCHDLDIIEATRRLGLHLADRISPDGLAFTLAYFALLAARTPRRSQHGGRDGGRDA